MYNIYKKFIGVFIFFFGLLFTKTAFAICQVCTVAVVAGSYIARQYGIDDTITGLWVGALTLIAYQWSIEWIEKMLKRKNKKLKKRAKIILEVITFCLFYAFVIWPLHSLEVVGLTNNQIFGIDKILFGIIVGTAVFFSAQKWYEEIKANNNGKAFFPFQKVVMPVGSLVLLSLVFYYLTKP
ncbi:MAG: hypothetical protein PHR47_02520 [Candidatus Pacebacteria bacterium]|nr:hypothetical protein [Candidatus Paceibacterota bacterium]